LALVFLLLLTSLSSSALLWPKETSQVHSLHQQSCSHNALPLLAFEQSEDSGDNKTKE